MNDYKRILKSFKKPIPEAQISMQDNQKLNRRNT